ncbi:MAG: hypothetical protein JSV86_10810 [Gemmatimonadota bacterium]|nr:MAG: hypothetical protein JSV86_10810 [Gemmatimonadota bacterium]
MPQLGEVSASPKFEDLINKTVNHALYSVSDGEVLIPFVMTLEKGEDHLYRLVADDMPAVQEMLKDIVTSEEKNIDAYAFAWDVLVSTKDSDVKRDAILVEGAERDSDLGVIVMQLYQKAGEGLEFGPIGDPEVVGHPPPRFGGAPLDAAAVRERFSDEEWDRLLLAPYLVFLTVAAADGDVDSEEIESFVDVLANAAAYRDDLLRALLLSTRDDAISIIKSLVSEPKDVKEELPAIAAIVDEVLEEGQAESFKKSLFFVGTQVAAASGEGIFGPDSKVSEGEATAMALIAMLLDVEM